MEVKFVTTTKENIKDTPVVDGQIIVSKDTTDLFYDMNDERHHISSSEMTWAAIDDDLDIAPDEEIYEGSDE